MSQATSTFNLKDYLRQRAQEVDAALEGFLPPDPNSLGPIVEAMRPDFTEVEEAAEILIAAQDKDWGPIQHAGKLHDRASYRYYWELLKRARSTGMKIPDEASRRYF